MRNFYLTCFALLSLMLSPSNARADTAEINAASRSVVRVAVFSAVDGERKMVGHGSGVVVAPDKIITNAHVVEESLYNDTMTFQIIPSQGRESYMATVIKWSPDNDLALLQLEPGAKLIPASLYNGAVVDGTDTFAIGYPASVDIAMQYNDDDMLKPQSPIKTRGTISAGRSSKSFDTVLHTAPIGPGNSGGPILDACGRVIGINSFGSTSENGGANFYFAISLKEVAAFLRAQKVTFNPAVEPCRSVAELSREEAARDAAARVKIEAEQRIAAELQASKIATARRNIELSIIAERDDRLAFAGLMLAIMLGFSGGAYVLFDKKRRVAAMFTAAAACAALLLAVYAFAGRPRFSEVESRMKGALPDGALSEGTKT